MRNTWGMSTGPTEHPDYIVVRASVSARTICPPEFIEGKWFDRRDIPIRAPREPGVATGMSVGLATAMPTGELVTRGDGAVGEIWELTVP